jgi:peptide/nickel transport system substrate-binding protein
MRNPEELVPNERLRRARSLKGWSQAELAEQVGTSFEMVSRQERGVFVPSPYYRERLCAVLGQTAEELGLMLGRSDAFTPPTSPLVLLASSHEDAEKAILSHLKIALQERGITLWSSRQLGRQGTENARKALREVVRTAQVILVILSPEARSSRHVREALEMASVYQHPVCGVWIEGEHWQECLPKSSVELAAPIDARQRAESVVLEEITTALERVGLAPHEVEVPAKTEQEVQAPTVQHRTLYQGLQAFRQEARDDIFGHESLTEEPAAALEQATDGTPPPRQTVSPPAATTPLPADLPLSVTPTMPVQQRTRRLPAVTTGLLIGLVVLVIAGGILGSLSLLTHFGVLGTHSGANAPTVVRGGTWTEDFPVYPTLIPDTSFYPWAVMAQQALYLPLFYGDAHGVVHPGAATAIPTVHNGGVSADATTWTFHLRPHLVWSDGQPYDACDVAFTWKLMLDPKFYYAGRVPGLNPTSSVAVSTDHLSITFHLKQPYAPFLALWLDGYNAPLPAHHFSSMTPEAILKSADLLNPKVVSGPFMMAESVPGDRYTLVRNPRYYRASEGLPYLDKVNIRIVPTPEETVLKDLQAGSIDSYDDINSQNVSTNPQAFQRFNHYTLISSPTSAIFLGLFFNFENTVLATHVEVRTAMAMAIDHQGLIATVVHGFGEPICTDHGSFYHPGYEPTADCPPFDLTAANKLLDDNGWVKGLDGVRTKGKQRLEFELSTNDNASVRIENELIVQHDLSVIGIKLDIQNYGPDTFFGSFLDWPASPPTGAVAGRYDIAEYASSPNNFDPDDSELLSCNQYPRYCNSALDALYKQEITTLDPGLRQQIFEQIHHIYLTDFPFITLYFPLDVAVVRKGTHNYQPSPYAGETVNIWEWWCDHGKC